MQPIQDPLEARTAAIGRTLLDAMESYHPHADERVQDWLLARAIADDAFRTRMLRFVDVLAAVEITGDADALHRLLREYFTGDFPGIPRLLRWLLRIARDPHTPSAVVAESARRGVELFARRFIVTPEAGSTERSVDALAARGRAPSFDLLGEAVLSDAEAAAYEARYLALLEDLGRHPRARTRTAGGLPWLQVSLKLSSLAHRFTPVDLPGSVDRVLPRLVRIAETARSVGIGLCVDAEQRETRDVGWAAFQDAFGPGGPLRDWPDAGLVVQAYLRDADRHLDEVLAFARARGTPFQVRLVKGAYWDQETIVAVANGWPAPVFRHKAETDATCDRLTERLVDAVGRVAPAIASHNPRAHARAQALLEARGLSDTEVEHQTLHRTLESLSAALARQGWPTRDYVPSGALIPGMAYLVRRILENASQTGFLMQSRRSHDREALLVPPAPLGAEDARAGAGAGRRDERAPAAAGTPPEPAAAGGFARAPAARWFEAGFRAAFQSALDTEEGREPTRVPLPAGLPAGTWVEVRSPSHPDGALLGAVEWADADTAGAAVGRARAAQPAWGARPVGERGAVLRRAADLVLARGHVLAAAIVREGGRERAGAWGEVEEAVDFLRLYAAEAERVDAAFGPLVRPRGVVAVIPPWNFSLSIPCGMTAAALAAGNAVVLKPAEQTPLVAQRLVATLHEAGVPADVLLCLPGAGEGAGRALVEDARVAMVAFTGSFAVGSAIHTGVSRAPGPDGRPRALVAEMGGKNPALVFADADLDEAVAGVLESAFGHANQKCSAVSRVLVEERVADRFVERLVEAARSLVAGPAEDPATQIDPIIDREAAARLADAAARARREGRVLLDCFGPAPGTLVHGPLVVEIPFDRMLDARTAVEELFGPILAVSRFADEEAAYRVANGTGYALTSAVFSRSPSRVAHAARAIEAGHVYVNRPSTAARPGIEPFGGMFRSGTGPKAGGADYPWAFLARTDAPADAGEVEAADGPPPRAARPWEVPLAERIAILERAAATLESGAGGDRSEATREGGAAAQLRAVAAAARAELAHPAPTVPVAGQHTEMRYDVARGAGVVSARGARAVWWLAASLVAGNGVTLVDAPALEPVAGALRAAGVPDASLRRAAGDARALVAAACAPGVAFVACDGGPFRSLAAALGPARPGDRGPRALLSPLDGPQPGEPGFVHRFAWPRVVAVRTLRHGAELAIEVD